MKCGISDNQNACDRILQNYSVTVNEIRESHLKRQIFYSKPIIKINDNYLFLNPYLMWFLFENCNYWLIRNHFKDKGSQKFTNAFGEFFEKYVKEVLEYCLPAECFKKIETHPNEKRADWIIAIDDITILVEQKSTLSGIGIKQQIADLHQAETYMKKTWGEALNQLSSTENSIGKTNAYKMVLLYEDYYESVCLKEVLNNKTDISDDGQYWLVSIREFEMLMFCYKMNPILFKKIIEQKAKLNPEHYGVNLRDVLNEYGITENDYLKDTGIISIYTECADNLTNRLDRFISENKS